MQYSTFELLIEFEYSDSSLLGQGKFPHNWLKSM